MRYYVGLDISVKETSVCIVNQDGDFIAESVAVSEPEAIYRYLTGQGYQYDRIGLEAGSLSPWLYQGLLNEGFTNSFRC